MLWTRMLPGALIGWIARLRFPVLLAVAGALFLVDLVVPDVLPFVDEVLLGVGTAVLASWKKGRDEKTPAPPA